MFNSVDVTVWECIMIVKSNGVDYRLPTEFMSRVDECQLTLCSDENTWLVFQCLSCTHAWLSSVMIEHDHHIVTLMRTRDSERHDFDPRVPSHAVPQCWLLLVCCRSLTSRWRRCDATIWSIALCRKSALLGLLGALCIDLTKCCMIRPHKLSLLLSNYVRCVPFRLKDSTSQ